MVFCYISLFSFCFCYWFKISNQVFQPIRASMLLFWTNQFGTGCIFSGTWHSFACFPVLNPSWMLSHTCWHQLHVFLRLTRAACLPVFADTHCIRADKRHGCMFSHWLDVFPRMTLAACSPMLDASYMFPCTWHWLLIFVSISDWFTALAAVIG